MLKRQWEIWKSFKKRMKTRYLVYHGTIKNDKLLIEFDGVLDGVEELSPTKRTVLKVAARLYDPMGIVSLVTVLMKMLLQEICARNLDLDSRLACDLENKWRRCLQSLRQAKYVMISRCLYAGVQEKVHSFCLHGFGDASKRAYCAVVYLVIRTGIGSYMRLITSKTRVAPSKKYTIPRLELLSGLILARLVSAVRDRGGSTIFRTSVKKKSDRAWSAQGVVSAGRGGRRGG